MKTRTGEVFERAIRLSAESYPNSVIVDLLTLFPIEVVAKILITFEGESVKFPPVYAIMNQYRNSVIKTTLDADNTAATRKRLAAYFGISADSLTMIYRRGGGEKRKVGPKTIKRSAKRARKFLMGEYYRDAKDTIYSR